MAFFDLSIPYSYPSPSGGKEITIVNKLRVKLATKAMELGYVGIAHSHSIGGVMTEKDSCTIPLLTLGSLIKAAPRLSSSVAFHRDLLGVPRSTPFRQYTRVTVKLESKAQCLGLNSGNPVLKSYDIVAVRPMNQFAFDQACTKAEVDIISIDFSNLPFRLMHPSVKAAIKRGIYFEIKYSDLLKDAEKRRQVISNAKLLVDWTKGKNLIISSGSPSVTELRGPNDVINLMSLLGLSTERARAAISKNCRNMIAKILKKKRFHKEAVKVELLSSSHDTFSLDDQPTSGDFMKWDPISSGEGDMLLEDLAKAFDATTRAVAPKSSKAIDVRSDRKGLPSHGFRLKDILGSEPSTQPPAAKMIDAPVHCKNQVFDACMADSASSVDNLRENETISQIEISEDDNKVKPTTMVPLRKSSTSQGQGLLVQDQAAAASFTPVRCTKSDALCDVDMRVEVESDDKSMSPSKIDHVVPQSPVEKLNVEPFLVHDEVSLDGVSKGGVISGHAKSEHSVSIDGDEMKIDGSLEAKHDEYMEVTVEEQKHKTGDSNINLPNLPSSETTDLLKESGNSLSPEAAGQDHDRMSMLDSSEAELREEPSVRYNIVEITMEDKKESETETETNQQAHVQPERNSGNVRAKRSRVRLTQLQPLKPFLLQRFKRISKRRKHRRGG